MNLVTFDLHHWLLQWSSSDFQIFEVKVVKYNITLKYNRVHRLQTWSWHFANKIAQQLQSEYKRQRRATIDKDQRGNLTEFSTSNKVYIL